MSDESSSQDPTRIEPDRAVIDRVVGDTAVLLVGPDGDELLLPAEALPPDVADGTWVVLDLATDPPTVLDVDQALTDARATELSQRLGALRKQRRGGRFDR